MKIDFPFRVQEKTVPDAKWRTVARARTDVDMRLMVLCLRLGNLSVKHGFQYRGTDLAGELLV